MTALTAMPRNYVSPLDRPKAVRDYRTERIVRERYITKVALRLMAVKYRNGDDPQAAADAAFAAAVVFVDTQKRLYPYGSE